MTPAAHHLLAALHDPSGRDEALLAGLTGQDWTDVAQLAIRQRVGPLLLSRPGLRLPASVRATLHARAQQSAIRVLRQQAAFRELAGALAPVGITLIILKGLHLATAVYPSAGLREMNDIDALVRPEHVEAVSGIVRSLGYRPLGEVPVPIALKAMHHVPRFIRTGVGLEVHWRLAAPGAVPRAEPEELWGTPDASELAPNARTLTVEQLLVHLCAHAATSHHFEQGLRPLSDVQTLLERPGATLSWDVVADTAERWGCMRSVSLVLTLAHRLLGAKLPAEVLRQYPDVPPGVVSLAAEQIFADSALIYDTSVHAGELLTKPTVSAKLRYFVSRVFLPPEQLATMFPDMKPGLRSQAIVATKRVRDLLVRHGYSLLVATLRPRSALRHTLDQRNALADWIREG